MITICDGNGVASVLVDAKGTVNATHVGTMVSMQERMSCIALMQPRDPLAVHEKLASTSSHLYDMAMQKTDRI